MANEVYSIGIDLSQLKEALKVSQKIKDNTTSDDKKKGGMLGDLDKSNKQLKEQNKQLGITGQKLNLIRLTASKIGIGALALGGLGIAGMVAGIGAMKGSLSNDLRARNVGLNFGQSQALGHAGKMTGLGEDTLISSIEGLSNSLNDFSKFGNFAGLGLNAAELKKKNPTEALFDVLDTMKKSDLPQYMKKNIIDDLGIPFDQFKFVLNEGTGELRSFYKQGLGIFGKSGAGLKAGERALIQFQAVLKNLSQTIGGKLALPLTRAIKTLLPLITKTAVGFGWLLDKAFSKRNIALLEKAFSVISDISNKLFKEGGSLLKNVGAGLVKGFNKVWELAAPSIKEWGKSVLSYWNMIKPELMKFIAWFKKDILPVLINIIGNSISILAKIMKASVELWKGVYTIIKPIMKPLGKLLKFLFDSVNKALSGLNKFDFTKLTAPIKSIAGIGEGIGKWWHNFKSNATSVWQHVKNSFTTLWKDISKGASKLWDSMRAPFLIMITGLIDMINGILSNKVVSTLTGGAMIQAGWGYDEQGNLARREYYGKGKNDYRYTSINDGVITKDGQVIKTNPQDYIFAMKQPQALASGGSYTININATVRNDNDVAKIKNELNKLITQLNAKR